MPINSDSIQYIVGGNDILENMPNVPALPMFSNKSVSFLSALSYELLHDKNAKSYADVISYAYWIRKASIESVKKKHTDYKSRIGRGVSFHIAPSNVPVNFAVSMTSAILAGNAVIIRLSGKPFAQADIICNAINKLLDNDYKFMKPYFCLIRYEYNDEITNMLSSLCDIRIIWGGNMTIEKIRKSLLPPRAIELAFADRYSAAIINSDEYLLRNPEEIAEAFYTDTYYTDQNACSSPRIVVWTGSQSDKARKIFWSALEKTVLQKYDMKPVQSVDKYSSFCILAMKNNKVKLVSDNNYIMRTEIQEILPDIMEYKNGGGYFFEYTVKENLEEIVPLFTKSCQTVSVLGVDKEEVKRLVFENGVRGVDRIVPLGQTMGLEFIWDGYKMIDAMTRFVYTGEY
ncbi:MAG: acyl-CoA reductase [Oscillospiraceae bacterium]